MTMIIFLVGDIGGGKTTFAKAMAVYARQQVPDCRIVTNTNLGVGVKVEDINRWLAVKIIKEDKRYCLVIIDEAAQAGFESRGSGSYSAAIESRLITMARKIRIDLPMVSQLASMIEKRAQWMTAFTVLCEPWFDESNNTQTPDFFDYTLYDSHMNELDEFSLHSSLAAKYLWPGMDTDDIPMKESFALQLRRYYGLGYGKKRIHDEKEDKWKTVTDYWPDEFEQEVENFEQVMVSARR